MLVVEPVEHVVRPGLVGRGLSWVLDTLPGRLVIEYLGERVTPSEADSRSFAYRQEVIEEDYIFRVTTSVVVDITV